MDTGNVRLDISGESAHEKALLDIHRDVLSRDCTEETSEVDRMRSLAALETHASALDIKFNFNKASEAESKEEGRRIEEQEFRRVKGRILSKIISKLEAASKERYGLAKSSFDLGLGGTDEPE